MSALDKCHYQIVHALENGGWRVEKLSPHLYDRETDSFVVIDIDASRPTNGSGHQQLYVEVKCFPGHNFTQELYIALG